MSATSMLGLVTLVIFVLCWLTPLGNLVGIFFTKNPKSLGEYVRIGVFKQYAQDKYDRIVSELIAKCENPNDVSNVWIAAGYLDKELAELAQMKLSEILLKAAETANGEKELMNVLRYSPFDGRAREVVLEKLAPFTRVRIVNATNSAELLNIKNMVDQSLLDLFVNTLKKLVYRELLSANKSSDIMRHHINEEMVPQYVRSLAMIKMHQLSTKEVYSEISRLGLTSNHLHDRIRRKITF